MATAVMAQDARLINFVVSGQARSGSSIVQSAIMNTQKAVCHENLLHEREELRKASHEAYFGEEPRTSEGLPSWFTPIHINPWTYLNHRVFDNNLHEEAAVGCRLPYPEMRRYELYDLLQERCHEGDFCLVHVSRNPVACYVSLLQAKQTGVWSRSINDQPSSKMPDAVELDPELLTDFVRDHLATRERMLSACPDALDIKYRDLHLNFQKVMRSVFEFLELDPPRQAMSSYARLRNRKMQQRIANLQRVRSKVPSDVREQLDAPDLF